MKSPVPLKRYLSLHVAVVAVLPVVTIAVLVWFFIVPGMRGRIGAHHQALAHAVAGQIATYLKGGEGQLNALAEVLRDRTTRPGTDVVRLLDAHCGSGAFFETLFIVDPAGTTIEAVGLPASRRSSRADYVGLDLSGRKVAGPASGSGGAAWSQTFLSTVSSRMAVALTMPLADGFVIGEVTIDKLSRFIRHLPVESGFLTMVVDGQGQIVADSRSLHWGEMLRTDFSAAGRPEGTTPKAVQAFEWNGQPMLGTMLAMDTAGWKVLVAQPVRNAFQPLRDAFALIAFGLAVALGLVVAISWLLGDRFALLVASYAEGTKSIAEGRYDLKLPPARTREFSRLGENLQRTAETIRRREKALVESEGRLKKLTANVPGVVYQFRATRDHVYRFDFLSAKATAIFGLKADLDTFNIDFYACIPDDEKKRFLDSVRRSVDRCEPWTYEGRFTRPGGMPIWFSSHAAPQDKGDDTVYYGIFQDITRRKKVEEELRQLRNYLSNIIDSMPSALVAVDREGHVTQWNQQTARMTGMSFEEARNHPLAEVFPRMAGEMERVQTAIQERQVISAPKVSSRHENETRFEDITIFPLAANGVEGAVIRVDDVTERVRLEEMMIQSEKMLSVGGLAAGMAHEINNPLAGMMQTAEVMAHRLGAGLDLPANRNAAEAAGTTIAAVGRFMEARGIPRMLATINDSGRRVAAIVDNMLSFARKSDATVSSHVLGDLLDKTVELAATDYDLKKQFDFKRIEIRREYAEPPVSVPCEGAKIQQVLLNILRNGAEAMQEAGTQAPRFIFRTRVDSDANMAVLEIEDNGPGMDEQNRKRIFEPFFTTKPAGVGTGLGLSVSYFIVTENHGGEMDVKTNPGTGMTFTVRLPMKGKATE